MKDVIRDVLPLTHDQWNKVDLLDPKKAEGEVGYLSYLLEPGKTRMKIKTHRFITKKLGFKADVWGESRIEQWSNEINMASDEVCFEVLRGMDVVDAYINEVGGHSCMTGLSRAEYLGLYQHNPEKVGLLVATVGKQAARRLVWEAEEGVVVDRIYCNTHNVSNKMMHYCEEQGWEDVFNRGGDYNVRGLKATPGEVPYMDSFCYGKKEEDGTVSLTTENKGGYNLYLQSCYGQWEESHMCADCGLSTSRYNSPPPVSGRILCWPCYERQYWMCYGCHQHQLDATRRTLTIDGMRCPECAKDYRPCPTCKSEMLISKDSKACCECEAAKPQPSGNMGDKCYSLGLDPNLVASIHQAMDDTMCVPPRTAPADPYMNVTLREIMGW